MNTLLQSLLAREQAQRNAERAARGGELAEAADIVAALHGAYAPFHEQVQSLKLRGDYGAAVTFGDRAEYLCRVATENGLELRLGAKILPAVLRLSVVARRGATPASIRLFIQHRHAGNVEELASFGAGHSPEDMVRALLEQLMRHVHDDSLAEAA
ncbi:MAG: hypothetical protein JSR43_13830 [Proteobacteria bacterium]|jgi:hypothetical protein|nr:hypothetical protein [Pseudomonadota bacterium]